MLLFIGIILLSALAIGVSVAIYETNLKVQNFDKYLDVTSMEYVRVGSNHVWYVPEKDKMVVIPATQHLHIKAKVERDPVLWEGVEYLGEL